jgi:multicomponent Na+:H+ antiporter subunit D
LKTVEPAPLQGSYNFAIVNTIGGFMIVLGIGLLYARTGALNFAQVGRAIGSNVDNLFVLAFLLICVGYLVKAAIVPFHFWLADAHAVAPSPVCVLFSGVMVELGIYAVARVYWTIFHGAFAAHSSELRNTLLAFAALTAVVGGLMCYAEHHLKRLLAFSTISHAGLMLAGFALLTPKALAGFLIYVLSHGVIKGGLFLATGIVLHRLRRIGEEHLHGRGRDIWPVSILFLLGAWGLAGAPPFGTLLGESMISDAGIALHQSWLAYLFMFVEGLTAAAVFRITFRIFFGWGEPAPSDEASQVEERPETREQHHHVPAVMVVPTAALILLGIALFAIPQLRSVAEADARVFTDQGAYSAAVLDNSQPPPPALEPSQKLTSSLIRSSIAGALALLLALGSVFRERAGRMLRLARVLETGNKSLRHAHSGHPGDYVAWLTLGTAAMGGLFVWLLR